MSVARLKTVKKAQKDQGKCGKCGQEIKAGDGYRWFKVGFRSRWKQVRCLKNECHPKPSERESTSRSGPMAAVENWNDNLPTSQEDIEGALQDVISAFEEYRDECQGALDGWPNGNSQLEERLEMAEQAVSTLEQIDINPQDEGEEGEDGLENILERIGEEIANAEGEMG